MYYFKYIKIFELLNVKNILISLITLYCPKINLKFSDVREYKRILFISINISKNSLCHTRQFAVLIFFS